MWPSNLWPNIWSTIWVNYQTSIVSRVITRYQEMYKATEFISADAVILETNVTSDIISVMEKIVDALFEDTNRAIAVKNLIETTFITGTGVKADLMTIRSFADQLQVLVNT